MTKVEGWVMTKDVDYPCSKCMSRLDEAEMSACPFDFREFPNYLKCKAFVPADQAEGG